MQTSLNRLLALLNQEFSGSSDRSCVIVAASMVDYLLGECLKAFLVPNDTTQDPLFDGPTAPIGTFSSRIDLAYRLGLIGPQFARDLHLIRRMRNDFAHAIEARTFEEPSFADRVLQLVKSLNIKNRCSTLLDPPYHTVRGHFIIVTIVILMHMETWREMPSLSPLRDDPLYTFKIADSSRNNS
jgi:DNA-binding MltR family transcriptional regulator